MRYEKQIVLERELLETVERLLRTLPNDESTCMGEEETISVTVQFANGFEMDIKCCGVQYEEGGDNTPWTEAVLFKNGSECGCTEPCTDFGPTNGTPAVWVLTYQPNRNIRDEDEYVVTILPERTDEDLVQLAFVEYEKDSLGMITYFLVPVGWLKQQIGERSLSDFLCKYSVIEASELLEKAQKEGVLGRIL